MAPHILCTCSSSAGVDRGSCCTQEAIYNRAPEQAGGLKHEEGRHHTRFVWMVKYSFQAECIPYTTLMRADQLFSV